MSLLVALLPLSAAFAPRMPSPASRAVAGPRASRPAMFTGAELVQPELADAMHAGTNLLAAVLEKDGSYSGTLSESIGALSPNGQAVTYGTYLLILVAAVQIVRVALPEILKIGFVIALIEVFGGVPPL